LFIKEQQVTEDLAKFESTNARVQKLARQLQEKAADIEKDRLLLSQRLQQCDALESQLKVWQKQLERGQKTSSNGENFEEQDSA